MGTPNNRDDKRSGVKTRQALQPITMLMKNKAQSCIGAVTHLFINRSDAAAVAQR